MSGPGRFPLHDACRTGNAAAVQRLLEANPAAAMEADQNASLPLHWAAYSGHEAAVRLLLQAAPEAAMVATSDDAEWDEGDQLPLHCAAESGHDAVVRLLLQAVPEAATAMSSYGHTPFESALENSLSSVPCWALALPPTCWLIWLPLATPPSRSSTTSCWPPAACPSPLPTGHGYPPPAPAWSRCCRQRWLAPPTRLHRWCGACLGRSRSACAPPPCAWAGPACRALCPPLCWRRRWPELPGHCYNWRHRGTRVQTH